MTLVFLISLIIIFLGFSLVFVVRSKALKKRVIKKVRLMNISASGKWTNAFLEEKRKHTDALADNTVQEIMAKNEKTRVNHLFEHIVSNRDHLPGDAPEELKEYFAKTSVLPAWADPDLIALGQQIYIRHGIWISLLLSYKSLPECYACAKGAEVLHRTARLNEQHGSMETYSRRIAETARFVMLAMSPGGLSPQGEGFVAAQKVRLIHAVIRYYLRQQQWDTDRYNEPINQEDMAGTLMSFSALILLGMEQLGIELEPVEKEAYIHCWRVIGHIAGLKDDMIPENAADAIQQGINILNHQKVRSEQGSSLMKALLEFQNKKSSMLMSPRTNIAMMRLMMGHELSDLLDVPEIEQKEIDKLRSKIRKIARVMEIMDHSLVLAMLLQFMTKLISRYIVNSMTKSKIINFYIPKSLKKDWGVATSKRDVA